MSDKLMGRDVFRPHNDPARAIYDAFQAEASKRDERDTEEWLKKEPEAVWRAACDYAKAHGLQEPTLAQVERAERYAQGSSDYGAQWAYALVRYMVPLN